jgi:putative ABC transport system substrate-binding protein
MGRTHRRDFLIASGALLAAPIGLAQQPKQVRRIGLLGLNSPEHAGAQRIRIGVLQALGKLGYREGENFAIELRYAEGKPERLPGLAAEIVRLDVEVIVSPVNATTRALQRATRTIPIVMVGSLPVENGFIASYSRPGGNVTGLDVWPTPELGAKCYQILKLAVPKAEVAVSLSNTKDPTFRLYGSEFDRKVTSTTGLTVVRVDLTSVDGLAKALDQVAASRPDVLLVGAGEYIDRHVGEIAAFASSRKLPSISVSSTYTSLGGLLHYGAEPAAVVERVASYVDRILRGAKPADLPVEQPTKYELVLNMKTARSIGLTLPPSFMAQVDRVIE